jgi:hypothetical protein
MKYNHSKESEQKVLKSLDILNNMIIESKITDILDFIEQLTIIRTMINNRVEFGEYNSSTLDKIDSIIVRALQLIVESE